MYAFEHKMFLCGALYSETILDTVEAVFIVLKHACQTGMQFLPFLRLVFGMTRSGREAATYRMRGGQANH